MAKPDEKPKPSRRAGDADVLALAEGLVAALGKAPSVSDLQMLRDVVDSYPDDGQDGAGAVVASFIGLLKDMIASNRFDREALAVHTRSWRFMVSRKPDAKERAAILKGLRSVRDLYAEARAAA
ncbi:hypothetical protein [Phenylobacterium sp.]|uniref:hypothetical protein n=1 Tax=Phenylobacterium sp. TaxID=1871053 RepID=UPI0025FACD26|nr:hypothetical protein [Phenylobacterium sp.]